MSVLSRGFASTAIAGVALALGACTVSGGGDPTGSSSSDISIRLPNDTIPVPIVGQQQDFTCGDVATLALLRYWQNAAYANVPESSLYAPLHTTRTDGTEPTDIAAYINGVAGMTAVYRTADDGVQMSDLEAAVDRGEPPIVDFQAWASPPTPWDTDWSDGHWTILIGYDASNLFFMDPSTGGHYGYVPRAEFATRWHDLVGTSGVPAYRMAIFVHGASPPYRGTPIPPSASPIH